MFTTAPFLTRFAPVDTRNPLNRAHPLNRGRVAWWLTLPSLYGGSKWYDIAGRNDGVLMNMASTVGWRGTTRPGGAGQMLFAAGAEYVLCKSGTIVGGLVNLTIAADMQTTYAAGNGPAIYTERAASGNDLLILDIASGTARIAYRNDGGSLLIQGGAKTVNDGKWHRVVLVKSGVNWSLYVDGVLDTTATFGSGSDSFTDAGIESRIGSDKGDGTSQWPGALDSVSLYSRALSASEVKADYDLSRAGYPGVLNRVGLWAYGAASGNAVFTQSFSGTLTPSGVLTKQVGKPYAGVLTLSGTVTKGASKGFAGAVTLSATFAALKVIVKSFTGSITATGTLTKRVAKSLAGTITSAGGLTKAISKAFVGTITVSGVFSALRVILKAFTGSITMSGTLTKRIAKSFIGTVTTTASFTKRIAKSFVGVVTMAGSLVGTFIPSGVTAVSSWFYKLLFGRSEIR